MASTSAAGSSPRSLSKASAGGVGVPNGVVLAATWRKKKEGLLEGCCCRCWASVVVVDSQTVCLVYPSWIGRAGSSSVSSP